ncbi:MAG: hypothetical protein OWT28_01080 [Firmicutes bacterium]|nr:hypothetical protein [Bacillota bacterium]
MTCEEAQRSMHYHFDGDDHLHVRKARAHAASCTDCGRHVMDLEMVEQGLRSLQKFAAPPGLRDRILEAVREVPQKRPLRGTGGLMTREQ